MTLKSNIHNKFGIDDHIYFIHEYGLDMDKKELYLSGEYSWDVESEVAGEPGVEHIMASKFIRNLNILQTRFTALEADFLIHMKTCGGIWEEGMAIHDAIKLCPNYITILNYTHARSMSSIIFCAADYKVMMPNSTFMFHQGTYGDSGTFKQVKSGMDFYDKANDVMLDIYVDVLVNSKHGKFYEETPSKVKSKLKHLMDKKEDVYLTADEAVEWGFADAIFDGNWKKLTNSRF